jgi:uncharacterized protein YcaQ
MLASRDGFRVAGGGFAARLAAMPRAPAPIPVTLETARRLWLRAQRLDAPEPFGGGPEATPAAVGHLGYVQIDTINVIERCHHHILFTRIPGYRRAHLAEAQSVTKSVFEYWTHALAYVPTRDYALFMPAMKRHGETPKQWFGSVTPKELRRVIGMIRREGALTIRDIDDEVLVDKIHPWASRKPSKRALQLAFYDGRLAIAARSGMLKTYELTERHFGWTKRPRPATEKQYRDYLLDRALRAQGLVSLDSVCHLEPSRKPAIRAVIEARLRRRTLVPVAVEGAGRAEHWAEPAVLEAPAGGSGLVHILSPFDPLVIQRKRLNLFFGYDHRFEAYLPKEKRVFGYFALPVLDGEEIVAAIDCKTDRAARKLLIQKWSWVGKGSARRNKRRIEEALHRFEAFQMGD